jgi:CDP-glucose 4,6-dehydratase
MGVSPNRDFWQGKRVLVTGHTGFKGAWASLWLRQLGAEVFGISLPPAGPESLFELAEIEKDAENTFLDIRDAESLSKRVSQIGPEIILHMAAQSLVRESVAAPVGTFATNVMGTANVLQAVRSLDQARAVLIVTSDKVYFNDGGSRPFQEDDRLGGKDPYSASKSAAEMVVQSYAWTYFRDTPRIGTARAGNVIGGGDYASDRIVPDIVRSVKAGRAPILRHPKSLRAWQHVLDCLAGYFLYLERLWSEPQTAPASLNFGPGDDLTVDVATLATRMLQQLSPGTKWREEPDINSREATSLLVDSTKAQSCLGFRCRLSVDEAIEWTAQWYREVLRNADAARSISLRQIAAYEDLS